MNLDNYKMLRDINKLCGYGLSVIENPNKKASHIKNGCKIKKKRHGRHKLEMILIEFFLHH